MSALGASGPPFLPLVPLLPMGRPASISYPSTLPPGILVVGSFTGGCFQCRVML